jgi:hypothetical protein
MSASDVFRLAGAVLFSVGGGGGLIIAFSSWLGRVWADRMLDQVRAKYARALEEIRLKYTESLARVSNELDGANRKLQAELDRTIHVYRVQFEIEFQALTDIWKAVSTLRSQIADLRPSMSVNSPDEDPEGKLQERFTILHEALTALQQAIDNPGPFYAEAVFAEVDKLLRIAKREELQLRVEEPFTPSWYDDGEKNKNEFNDQADVVAKVMRNRIAQLTVYGARG